MKLNNLIILFLIFLLSCSNNNSQTIDYKQVNKEYKSYKSFFDKNLVDHFPDKIDTNITALTQSIYNEAYYISLTLANNEKQLRNTNFSFIAKYKASDTCLFIIKSLENLDHRNTNLVDKISKTCNCKNLYPVFNSEVSRFKNKEINCKLQDDFTYYVIEAKSGKYLDDKYLKEANYMPEEWKHGFTRGFAISEEKEVIIYWVAIW